MGNFGDWGKGPRKDVVRVKVAYEQIAPTGRRERFEIITTISKISLNYDRDAKERVERILSQTVKPPDWFEILSTQVEGKVPFIHPTKSW